MQGTALQSLEADVRELIRRRRIDPARDDAEVRHLIREVLDEYDEGVLIEGRVPLADRQETHRLLLESVTGFGPLQPYLDDTAVEEIWINGPNEVFVARHGRSELTSTMLTEQQIHDLVERMLRNSGRWVHLGNRSWTSACPTAAASTSPSPTSPVGTGRSTSASSSWPPTSSPTWSTWAP